MWDPIKSAESAVKDFKSVATDAVHASKTLFDDACNVGKTALNGASEVENDVKQTAGNAIKDLSSGNITGAVR